MDNLLGSALQDIKMLGINFRSMCTEEERDSFGLDEQGRELGPWHGGRGSFAS